jgi:hypothetical protein
MCRHLRGWSHLGHSAHHLRGCPLAHRDSLPATCPKTAHMAIALGDNHWSWQHLANAVIHPVTRKEMEYPALMKDPCLQPLWTRGFGNECGRLSQVIQDIKDTNTCLFIKLTNVPKDRKINYGKIVCDYKPHKKEKERVRLTVGGDRLLN